MLWVVGSSFLIWTVWPAITPTTCGWYLQPLWSRTTGSLGTSNVRLPRPSFTYTNTFARSPLSATIFSASLVPLHAGSWDMSIFWAFGAAPSNFTVPLTEPTVDWSIGVAAGAEAGALVGWVDSAFSFLLQPASNSRTDSESRPRSANLILFMSMGTFLRGFLVSLRNLQF